jgi:response regulator RpfG family c-di-GMP phosphodiesterase
MEKVLLVDDEKNILLGYKRNLRSKFNIFIAESGKEAIKVLKENGPFAVVVSDFKMPQMNGVDFLAKVKKMFPDTVRMMLTGYADLETTMQVINEGNIYRFLTKPCSVELLLKNIYDATEQYQLIISERELLTRTLKGSVKILVEILSTINPESFNQATKFRELARKILLRIGITNTWEVEMSVLLSQIGLVTIPSEIVSKKNNGEELSREESNLYFSHTDVGRRLLQNIPRLEMIAEGISYQYMSYNGVGGIKDFKVGENIPFIGRVLKVLNDFGEFLKQKYTEEEAIDRMQQDNQLYDPEIFGSLVAEIAGFSQNIIIVNVNVADLRVGSILAEGIKNAKGFLLFSKGTLITDVILIKLLNYAKMTKIIEPIKIVKIVSQ